MTIRLNIRLANNHIKQLTAEPGTTLLHVLQHHKIDEIEGSCGGAMACSTCHVIIEPAWYSKLLAPTLDETDMLDLASNLTSTSRLACQIVLTESMDGMVLHSPYAPLAKAPR